MFFVLREFLLRSLHVKRSFRLYAAFLNTLCQVFLIIKCFHRIHSEFYISILNWQEVPKVGLNFSSFLLYIISAYLAHKKKILVTRRNFEKFNLVSGYVFRLHSPPVVTMFFITLSKYGTSILKNK